MSTPITAPTPEVRDAYRPSEVAKRLGISVRQTYRLIETRELGSARIGRSVIVPVEALEAYRERLKAEAGVA